VLYSEIHPIGQEGKMEMIIATVGAITGVAGLIISVFVVRWQVKVQAKSDRMTFLADRIFDITIPRELRLPFYEEYISRKGNGTAVKFWLLEETRERAAAIK
jgi:hypothetical protein